MKILYAIQCTGNGHLSRARDVIPCLMKYGEVDLLLSGKQSDVSLMYSVRFRKEGLTFTFGKKGGIDLLHTLTHMRPARFVRDIHSCPVDEYDIVINDFEPISAWACRKKKVRCIALSHQSCFLSEKTPRPSKRNSFAEMLLRNYAPVNEWHGFHFQSYDTNIHTPVIRSAVRHSLVRELDHVTVYLPAFDDQILFNHLRKVKEVRWEIFSKRMDHIYSEENVSICRVQDAAFIQSMATSSGVITGGGFETPAEVLFLGKKLLSIPMSDQYEQQCNSAALERMNVRVETKISDHFDEVAREWLRSPEQERVFYPNQTESIIARIISSAQRRVA